jgi:hypothetical protein
MYRMDRISFQRQVTLLMEISNIYPLGQNRYSWFVYTAKGVSLCDITLSKKTYTLSPPNVIWSKQHQPLAIQWYVYFTLHGSRELSSFQGFESECNVHCSTMEHSKTSTSSAASSECNRLEHHNSLHLVTARN